MSGERIICGDDEHDYQLVGEKYHKPTDDSVNAITRGPNYDSVETYVSLYCRKCGDTIERQATTGRPA